MRDERKREDDCCHDDSCFPSSSLLCWSPSSLSILLFHFFHLSFLFLLPDFLFRLRLRLFFLLCCRRLSLDVLLLVVLAFFFLLDVLLLVVLAFFFLLDVLWLSSSLSWLSVLFFLCCRCCRSSVVIAVVVVVVVAVASLTLMHLSH